MGYWSEEARQRIVDPTTGIGKATEEDAPPGTGHHGNLVVPVPLDLGKHKPQEKPPRCRRS